MMKLNLLRLLFDFGLVVLIWAVQLIIYPSFQYYGGQQLLQWHQKYTIAISFIVIPLMFGQLITATLQLLSERNPFTIGSLVLIGLVWLSTFMQFVPIHGVISSGNGAPEVVKELVSKNWIRTVLWTVIFLWTFLRTR